MEEEAGEIQIVRGAQPTLIGFEIGATDQRMWGPVETRNGIELTAKKKKKKDFSSTTASELCQQPE